MRGGWAAIILAFVMALIGIVLTVGGAWLLILGGSPYYVIAGIAMLASAWFLFRGRLLGGWIYIGLFIAQRVWGFAESRGNAWAMIPWPIAPLVLLDLRAAGHADADARRQPLAFGERRDRGCRSFGRVSFAILGTSGGTAVAALPAQSSPGMTDPSVMPTGADWPAYGGTNAAWRFSPLTQIDASTMSASSARCGKCIPAGIPTDPDYSKLYGTENTPLKVGNLLYTCTAKNVIVALDAATGKPVWRVDPHVPGQVDPLHDRVPRSGLLRSARRRSRAPRAQAGSSKARSIRG